MIEYGFGVSLTLPSISGLLASLAIKPRKTLRWATERCGRAIRQWKVTTYPELKKRAKERGAEIYFLDEAEVPCGRALGRSHRSDGRTPVVKAYRPREGTSVIRVVNARGSFRYHVCSGRLTAARFILSLKKLVTGHKKPVLLVIDELPVDKVRSVANYVQSTRGRLELHFLPPYAPDLHPDEFVWNHLQRGRTRNEQFRRDEPFQEGAGKTMRSTSACQKLVRVF
jgi:transposase